MAVLFLNAVTTATTTGNPQEVTFNRNGMVVQAIIRGTSGAVTATAHLYGSNDPAACASDDALVLSNAAKETLATFSLSGTGTGALIAANSAVATITAPYRRFWCDVTAISGTGAAVTIVGST